MGGSWGVRRAARCGVGTRSLQDISRSAYKQDEVYVLHMICWIGSKHSYFEFTLRFHNFKMTLANCVCAGRDTVYFHQHEYPRSVRPY